MEANLHYSIIAATIPCLKPFMRSLNSGYMSHRAPQSTIGSGVHSNSVPLTSISSQKGKGPMRSRRGPQSDGDGDSLVDVDDDNGYDSGTAGSDKMIIKYKKSWEVSYSIRNLECPS